MTTMPTELRDTVVAILDRKTDKGLWPTADESVDIKAALDYGTDTAISVRIYHALPLEWDEWHNEVEAGLRKS